MASLSEGYCDGELYESTYLGHRIPGNVIKLFLDGL
jgi:hypothetical protein